MVDANFNRKSVKELQKYLKERGVTFSDLRKAELVEICEAADRLIKNCVGIKKCVLIGFTNKGIFPVNVNFDEDMWDKMKATLTKFYEQHYLPVLLRRNNLR